MKYIFLFTLLLIKLELSAQKFQIINGDTIQVGNSYLSEIIAQDSSSFYVYTRGLDYSLRKFRASDAKLVYETVLTADKKFFWDDASRGWTIKHIEIVNNRILYFVQIREKSSFILTFMEFDASTGKQLSEPKVLDEQSTKGYSTNAILEKNEGKVDFKIIFSPDKTKLLIVAEKIKDEKEPDVTARLYDLKDYSKIWEKQTLKNFNNSTIFIYNYLVDNEANFFYLFKYLRSKQKDDVSIGVGMMRKNNFQNKVYQIPDKGRTIKEPKLKVDGSKIVCYGKFLDGEYTNYSLTYENCGYFFICIDARTFKTETEGFDYTKDHFSGYLASADHLEKSSDISLVKVKGGYYLIREFIWMINFRMNILICKYNTENKLEWMKEVNRDCEGPQNLKGEKIRGFSFGVEDNKLNMFYYEHKKNIAKFPDITKIESAKYVALKSPRDAVLVRTSINAAGELTREIVPKTQELFVGGDFPEELWIEKRKSLIVKNFMEESRISYSIFQVAP